MPSELRLLLACTFSLLLHTSLLVWQAGGNPHVPNNRLVVTLSPNQKLGARAALSRDDATPTFPKQAPAALQQAIPEDLKALSPVLLPRVALGSEALDSPLMPTEDLNLEPGGGFPAELSGQITLDLLIDEQGHTIWVGTVFSNVDSDSLQFVAEKFAQAKFSKPTVKGRASKVLIRVEIQVEKATPN